jgi:hypothetical protein
MYFVRKYVDCTFVFVASHLRRRSLRSCFVLLCLMTHINISTSSTTSLPFSGVVFVDFLTTQLAHLLPQVALRTANMTKRGRTDDEDIDSNGPPSRMGPTHVNDRCDPKSRGIHDDAIRVDVSSPSSRATCVDCNKTILKGHPRWGIKYAGNPLPIAVIPLYGSHPMTLWCHAGGCGLGFLRISPEMPPAGRTCHACQDTPSTEGLRLLCGGPPNKQGKIRQHAFHLHCWLKAIVDNVEDETAKGELLVSPTEIGAACKIGLSWADLTENEQQLVQQAWNESNK